MALVLSPTKLVLLAVHFAVNGDVDSLKALATRHSTILRRELVLRILLTCLPETVTSPQYVGLVQSLQTGSLSDDTPRDVDASSVQDLTNHEADKRVRKLRLLPLNFPEAPEDAVHDPIALFLLRRSYRVDEEAGLLHELPSLLQPFLHNLPCIRTLLVSTILPFFRRNREYYPHEPIQYTLFEFQQLPYNVAANLLLSQTGRGDAELPVVGRDLRGMIGPWLANEGRGRERQKNPGSAGDSELKDEDGPGQGLPLGWSEVWQWLTTHASRATWRVAVSAVEQWGGPGDVDLGGWGELELGKDEREALQQTYARAALGSAYLIPEASVAAIEGAYSIASQISTLRVLEPVPSLASSLALLPPLSDQIPEDVISARNTTFMRNNILSASNPLTTPTAESIALLQALTLSAYILTKAGCPTTVRRAGELALLQDEREQKAQAIKLLHAVANNGPKTEDKFWIKTRNEILWLRDWGAEEGWSSSEAKGVFSEVKREFLEVEIFKALLSNTRYALARSIYEDAPDAPLDQKLLQDTIHAAAMSAYDNASNPNRTRGGIKKCDDIAKAFPKTLGKSNPIAQRIEALLQATHALSEYRLVLKQGEPFTPIVLRVHSDPISIIGKILEQNPKSYTKLHDLADLGRRMVKAGLVSAARTGKTASMPVSPASQDEASQLALAERRITAMCIDAALTEDDFETAYSYVVNRLSLYVDSASPAARLADDYSWKAALQAGKYRRTARTIRPTHLGTGSANPDIRHLEQRIECLATALRIAPVATLQEILNAFRRAEEELDAAIKAEAEQEDEWDARGDRIRGGHMPGSFGGSLPSESSPLSPMDRKAPSSGRRQPQKSEEAPMSLFDLSRASVLSAQKNLSVLSGLQRSAGLGRGGVAARTADQSPTGDGHDGDAKRLRKRDQLREAAMGTLVSGVGWLVGAPPPSAVRDDD